MKNKNDIITSYGIIGIGKFGMALATELLKSGSANVLVLDQDEDKIKEIREVNDNAICIKSLDKKTLEKTGIKNCEIVIVCISDSIDVSVLTTMNLISLGIKRVISKASNITHGEILNKLGAEVVYPDIDMAVRLAHRLETTKVLDYVAMSEKLNISKIICPLQFVGHTVIDANLRGKFKVNIIAIENKNEFIDSVPPNYQFKNEDILYISGSKSNLLNVSSLS